MKKFVFDEKTLSMADLKETLDANFGLAEGAKAAATGASEPTEE
ncbi:hypothetical protein [Breoghania sp.]|nr:hypothetical protein [Breoghania sp.]MDJ0932680.1 hypothetical protein [Breoghania sp.]